MCEMQKLRASVEQILTAAAEEIFGVFKRSITEIEEKLRDSPKHNKRNQRLPDTVHQTEQQGCSPHVDQGDPEPPHIKEEKEEEWISQEGEQTMKLLLLSECPTLNQKQWMVKEEPPLEQQDRSPSLDQVDPEPPHIKEEENLWTNQEGEQLHGMKRGAKGKPLQSFFKAARPSDRTAECPQESSQADPSPRNLGSPRLESPATPAETVTKHSTSGDPCPKGLESPRPATPADCSAEREPPAKKAKTQKQRDQNRQIKAEWFSTFKWLKYDKEKNLFFCTDCVASKNNNPFTKGKCAKVPKKDDFTKHAIRGDHKMAAGAKERSVQMLKARAKADDRARESMTAAFKTVQWMAQEDIPNVKFAGLVDLQSENGAKCLRVLEKDDGSIHYSHHTSVNDLRECLATVVEEEMLLEVEEAEYFSLEADEATDCSNKSVLMVYIRYISRDGCPRVRFLGVREMEQTNADAITAALHQLLQAKGLNKYKMVGLATDGASVMTGVKVGVTTQFKKEVPFMVANHCMAHRLQLAAEKAANRVPLISKYIGTLNCFARVVKFSAKFTRTLEASQKIHSGQTKKIKEAFFTRWLSLCDGTQAMAGCIPAVLSALQQAATEKTTPEGKAQLNGLAADMGSYKFVYLTHFLADAVGLLGILSKLMQVVTPTYQDLKDAVESTVCSLLALKEVKGTCGFLEKLEGTFPATAPTNGKTLWEDHYVKDTKKQRDEVEKAVELFMDNLVTQLQCTFPDHDTMSAFDMFCPSAKLTSDVASNKLDKLLELYGKDKKKNGVTHTKVVDPDTAKTEWKILSPMVQKYNSMEDLYSKYVCKNKGAYPNMEKLLKIAITITVTSVNCERGVSRCNAIKTSSRNSLKVEAVDELVALSLEAPPYKQFPCDLAFRMWRLNRDRTAYRQMLKTAEDIIQAGENNNSIAALDKAMEELYEKRQALVEKLTKATAEVTRVSESKDQGSMDGDDAIADVPMDLSMSK